METLLYGEVLAGRILKYIHICIHSFLILKDTKACVHADDWNISVESKDSLCLITNNAKV